MDKLTAIKIKYDDGTYSDEIPVSVLSENVEWDSTHTLVDILGSIDVDVTGTIQDQISQLFNEKVSNSDMQRYISNSMPSYITSWLTANVNPVGSAVVVDKTLTISGAAADAKQTGDFKSNPFAFKSFIVPAGQSHSSKSDQLLINIKKNEKFILQWTGFQIFLYYTDGTSSSSTVSPYIGVAEKDIQAIGVYVSPSSDYEVNILAIHNPFGYDTYEAVNSIQSIQEFDNEVKALNIGKNLLGERPNYYYPCYIPATKQVTWSYFDHSTISASQFSLKFYDKDKNLITSYDSASIDGKISRTVTISSTVDTYYITIDRKIPKSLQVELGNQATEYEPYFANNKLLDKELNEFINKFPNQLNLTVLANQSHSSLNDQMHFILEPNEKYLIYAKSESFNNRSIQLYEYLNTVSKSKLSGFKPNQFYTLTSTDGADALSLFLESGTEDVNITLYALKESSLDNLLIEKITENENNIKVIDNMCRSTTFTVKANQTHSSLNDSFALNIPAKQDFYVAVAGLQERSGTVFVRNDNEEQELNSVINNQIVSMRSTININHIGLYTSIGNTQVDVTFIVFTDKSIFKFFLNSQYDEEYLKKLLNAKRKANAGNYNNLTTPEIFTISHFSDIHGSSWAMKQIQSFKDSFNLYLDDIICTGDLVQDKLSDGLNFWNNNSDGETLICIGNHDSLGTNGWSNPVSQEVLYNTYIKPYEALWNANTIENHSYWYKDYNEKKIRLISIDATIYDTTEQTAQMTWFQNALNEAKTNGYSVMGAIHFPPMPQNFQKIDSNFTALLHGTGTDMSQFAWHTNHTDILTAVNNFINDGGDFICWLSGHTHYDLISYDTRFPKQLFITISCAMPSSMFEERIRDISVNAGLVLNTICVDTTRKYIKLLRYGAEWDDCLRHVGTCTIDYSTAPATVKYNT